MKATICEKRSGEGSPLTWDEILKTPGVYEEINIGKRFVVFPNLPGAMASPQPAVVRITTANYPDTAALADSYSTWRFRRLNVSAYIVIEE